MLNDDLESAFDSAVADGRFWAKVSRTVAGCWEWQGYRDRQGYGHLMRDGVNHLAHRYAFALVHGPASGVVRHSCDNPPCCNPRHLQDGSQSDNIDDRQRRGRHRPGRFPGEAHPSHRLTNAQILDARSRRASGESVKSIAKLYGTSYGWMQRILVGKAWSHLCAA